MQDYILNRLRIDSAHTLNLAKNESLIQHQGLKGRLRELLIDNLLTPWLPPLVACGTGMIISAETIQRQSTQDDIIIYDRSLVPPVLVSHHAPEGVFLFNSVISRIEVKSTLRRDDIRRFIRASAEIGQLKFTVRKERDAPLMGPLNMLFAYDSDATGQGNPNYQLERILEVMHEENVPINSGIVSAICMPNFGLWKIGLYEDKLKRWQRLNSKSAADHLAWFVAILSSSCYVERAKRQGRNPDLGVETGIGTFIPDGSDVWHWVNNEV